MLPTILVDAAGFDARKGLEDGCPDSEEVVDRRPTNPQKRNARHPKRFFDECIAAPTVRSLMASVVEFNRENDPQRPGCHEDEVEVLLRDRAAMALTPVPFGTPDDVGEADFGGDMEAIAYGLEERSKEPQLGDRSEVYP